MTHISLLATLVTLSIGEPVTLAPGASTSGSEFFQIEGDGTSHLPAILPELARADVEAWLDGYLKGVLGRSNIAGGVVVVVAKGAVLLEKGFGRPSGIGGLSAAASRALCSRVRTWGLPGSCGPIVSLRCA